MDDQQAIYPGDLIRNLDLGYGKSLGFFTDNQASALICSYVIPAVFLVVAVIPAKINRDEWYRDDLFVLGARGTGWFVLEPADRFTILARAKPW